jgi:hypothetical protein
MSSSQEAAERAWRASNAEAAGVELSSGGEGSEGEGAAPSEPGSTGNGNGSHAGAKRRRALKGAAAGTGDGSSAAEIQQVRGECWCWIALSLWCLTLLVAQVLGAWQAPEGRSHGGCWDLEPLFLVGACQVAQSGVGSCQRPEASRFPERVQCSNAGLSSIHVPRMRSQEAFLPQELAALLARPLQAGFSRKFFTGVPSATLESGARPGAGGAPAAPGADVARSVRLAQTLADSQVRGGNACEYGFLGFRRLALTWRAACASRRPCRTAGRARRCGVAVHALHLFLGLWRPALTWRAACASRRPCRTAGRARRCGMAAHAC